MTMEYSPAANLTGGVSLVPQSVSGSSAVNGAWVDLGGAQGQPIYADLATGAISGSPTATALAWKLQEADTSAGAGAADITGATSTLSTASSAAVVQGKRSKRYVRVVVTPAFTAGTSPAVLASATVRGQKILG
jgi:hypothetical protein